MEEGSVTSSPAGALFITIDAEEDDAWSRRPETTTRNAVFLPRFQELCEKFGFVPVYLTNYAMARDPAFAELGRAAIRAGTAEIGMHLHAWNSPPFISLGEGDIRCAPYLIEFPDDVLRSKVESLTRLLEDVFSAPMISHRAGRWALNAFYVRVLAEFGYKVDCSVTPHVDWSGHRGVSGGQGGSDYCGFPDRPYWIGGDDISRSADSDLLEVPMTVVNRSPAFLARVARSVSALSDLPERALKRLWPLEWMRPNGHNLKSMLRILNAAQRERWPYVEFMLHSSELMPGGSPTFPDEPAIERLYDDLTALFDCAQYGFRGQTLAAFRDSVRPSTQPDAAMCGTAQRHSVAPVH